MTDLIIASTATSFFWQTFEYRTVECPSQLIVVCVKLSYNSLGLAFPGLEFLQNLHERVSHAALKKIIVLGVAEPKPPAESFLDCLASHEIEVLEKIDFDCVANNSFQHLDVSDCEIESLAMFYRLHALLLCLNLSKSAWRFSPPNLASVTGDIWKVVFAKYALTKDPNDSRDFVSILNDLIVLSEIFDAQNVDGEVDRMNSMS